jgi:S1-C subfamily serine protease
MNAGFRRLLALGVVFLAAFVGVTLLRQWRTGGSWRDWLSGKSRQAVSQPTAFSMADHSPLELNDVELLARLNGEYAKLTKAVVPSVVSIDTAGVRFEKRTDAWGRAQVLQRPTQGQGSGVIISREGHVVTNHHVIAGRQKAIQVTLHDGKQYPAMLVGENSVLDIAVLKIQGNGTAFTPLKFGDSAQAEVGQIVFAIGNPFGLGETVTQGIISAKERSISEEQVDLFQTDAAINPGNSGGPLVNLRGEIIGINVAIFSPNRDNPGFQGVGFSIPANDVKEAVTQIIEKGEPVYGYLGLNVSDPMTDAARRAAIGYPTKDGVLLSGVAPGSPAEAAGLRADDVIQAFGNEDIRSMRQLAAMIQRSAIGREVSLKVWREGKVITVNAVVGSGMATVTREPQAAQKHVRDPDAVLQAVGIEVRDLFVPERLRGFRGVVVTRVLSGAVAQGKVQPGDLIVAVNQIRVSSANEFFIHLAASAVDQTTVLTVRRGGQYHRVELPPAPAEALAPRQ